MIAQYRWNVPHANCGCPIFDEFADFGFRRWTVTILNHTKTPIMRTEGLAHHACVSRA